MQLNTNGGTTALFPVSSSGLSLGLSGRLWSAVYAANGTIQTSDSDLKDHAPLTHGLEKLLLVETIQFRWKSQNDLPDGHADKDHVYYGVKADQLDALFPELVYNETKPYHVNYAEMIPICINAIQELNAALVDKQRQIDALQAQMVTVLAALPK
jgi:hypothetical protein